MQVVQCNKENFMSKSTQKTKKKTIEKTTSQKQDRNWIKPPNTISNKSDGDGPQKLSYWIDQKKEVQLYTKDQLVTCNVLNNLNFLLVRALVLMDTLQTMDKDIPVGTLIKQGYAKYETSESSVFNHFIQLMAAVPDITFGEFLGFISPNTDTKEFLKMGKERLKKVAQGEETDINIFYTSDKVKKS